MLILEICMVKNLIYKIYIFMLLFCYNSIENFKYFIYLNLVLYLNWSIKNRTV